MLVGRLREEHYLRLLEDGNPSERERAALELGALSSLRAVEPLARLWRERPESDSPWAKALVQIGPASAPPMIAALREGAVTREDAVVLASFGPIVVADLVGALGDQDPWVREAALYALEALGPSAAEALPSIRGALLDDSSWVSFKAVSAFASIGPMDESGVSGPIPASDRAPRQGESGGALLPGPGRRRDL